MKNENISKIKPIYFLAAFAAAAALIKLDELLSFCGKIIRLLLPAVFGFIIAAVLDEPVKRCEEVIGKIFKKSSESSRRNGAVIFVYLFICAVIAVVIASILPKLAESAALFANSFENFLHSRPKSRTAALIAQITEQAVEWLRQSFPQIAEKAYDLTSSAVGFLTNAAVAAFISLYLLLDKEKCLAAACKVLTATLGEQRMYRFVHGAGVVTGCFSRFIYGQLTEGFVLGVMCFVGMVLLGFDYPLLISVLIGVTALIPIVGGFIGAVPAALMLFLIEPSRALWFIVYIIVLQQIEGNLVYPKIVGRSVGLPPILILIAIVMGAGLAGIPGILIGIPAASAVYITLNRKTGEGKSTA